MSGNSRHPRDGRTDQPGTQSRGKDTPKRDNALYNQMHYTYPIQNENGAARHTQTSGNTRLTYQKTIKTI